MTRKEKSTLDLVRPDLTSSVNARQLKQYHDMHLKQREFNIGDNIFSLVRSRKVKVDDGSKYSCKCVSSNNTRRCYQ